MSNGRWSGLKICLSSRGDFTGSSDSAGFLVDAVVAICCDWCIPLQMSHSVSEVKSKGSLSPGWKHQVIWLRGSVWIQSSASRMSSCLNNDFGWPRRLVFVFRSISCNMWGKDWNNQTCQSKCRLWNVTGTNMSFKSSSHWCPSIKTHGAKRAMARFGRTSSVPLAWAVAEERMFAGHTGDSTENRWGFFFLLAKIEEVELTVWSSNDLCVQCTSERCCKSGVQDQKTDSDLWQEQEEAHRNLKISTQEVFKELFD